MKKDIYVWSEPGRTDVSYAAIISGITRAFNRLLLDIAAKEINQIKDEGYKIHLDQSWTGKEFKIYKSVRSKLLKKLGIGENKID